MRILLGDIVIFLLPTVLFLLYVRILKLQKGGRDLPSTPYLWLIMAGLACVIISFLILGLPRAHAPDEVYVPAHMEGGTLAPGRTVPR